MDEHDDQAALRERLTALCVEHRDLDAAIDRMTQDLCADQLQLRRLKKRKLMLKDSIARLQSRLIPNLKA